MTGSGEKAQVLMAQVSDEMDLVATAQVSTELASDVTGSDEKV